MCKAGPLGAVRGDIFDLVSFLFIFFILVIVQNIYHKGFFCSGQSVSCKAVPLGAVRGDS